MPRAKVAVKIAATLLLLSFCIAAISALLHGPLRIPFSALVAIASGHHDAGLPELATYQYVITHIRAPRLLCAIAVGAALAASGCALQSLFRNPLADPALIGISSGAALGAVSVIVLEGALVEFIPAQFMLPIAAFISGVLATFCVVAIANTSGRINAPLLLLAGVAINAIAQAGIGLLTYIADDNQLRDLTFWSMGSVAKAGWQELVVAIPTMVIASALILRQAAALNAMLLGESAAHFIGHDVKKIKRQIILASALAVGAAVSVSGVIFFIGLVVPHLVRLCCGPDNRVVLPLSTVLGAALLISADIIARSVVAPAELPIGLLMSLIGGPFFVALLISRRKDYAT